MCTCVCVRVCVCVCVCVVDPCVCELIPMHQILLTIQSASILKVGVPCLSRNLQLKTDWLVVL